MLTEQEKAWLERRKNLCSKCIHKALGCILGKSEGKRECIFFDADLGELDYKDAAEFEARVALWVTHNGCPNFDHPCWYLDSSRPYPYMSWKGTGGECPHIPYKHGYCNRWCKLMTARLAVEKEMEKEKRQ